MKLWTLLTNCIFFPKYITIYLLPTLVCIKNKYKIHVYSIYVIVDFGKKLKIKNIKKIYNYITSYTVKYGFNTNKYIYIESSNIKFVPIQLYVNIIIYSGRRTIIFFFKWWWHNIFSLEGYRRNKCKTYVTFMLCHNHIVSCYDILLCQGNIFYWFADTVSDLERLVWSIAAANLFIFLFMKMQVFILYPPCYNIFWLKLNYLKALTAGFKQLSQPRRFNLKVMWLKKWVQIIMNAIKIRFNNLPYYLD